MEYIKQIPTPPNEWLHNGADGNERYFTRYIIRPNNVPAWAECTTAEKEQWELEYPIPEPIEEPIEVEQ